jgi:PIN domain
MDKAPQTTAGGLRTHHVFLDTEVYRQLGHNPENPLLKALGDHINTSGLILHTSDITFAEIERQLHDFVGKTALAMATASRQLGRWRHRLPHLVSQDVPTFDQDRVAGAAYAQLRQAAITDWHAVWHKAMDIPAREIFEKYFKRQPPFAAHDSKEFPDGFVVRALEKWCLEHKESMYVVTADRAMTDAVRATTVLLAMKSLDDVLAALAATETPNVRETAEKLLSEPSVRQGLQDGIEANIGDLIPIYVGDELPEGEVAGHDLAGEIEGVDFKVVAASDNDVSLMLDVRTPLLIQVDYEDRSEAIYDKEDDVYFGAETAQTEIEDDPVIRVFVKLTCRPPGIATLRILTGEVDVSEPYETYK